MDIKIRKQLYWIPWQRYVVLLHIVTRTKRTYILRRTRLKATAQKVAEKYRTYKGYTTEVIDTKNFKRIKGKDDGRNKQKDVPVNE